MKRYLSNCLPENACVRAAALYLLIAVLCPGLAASAFPAEIYYGVIQDEDGYSNVRKSPGVEYEVVDTLFEGEEFLYAPQKGNWWKVYEYYPNARFLGYLQQSRISRVDREPSVGEFSKEELKLFFQKDTIEIPPVGSFCSKLKYAIANLDRKSTGINLYRGPGEKYKKMARRAYGYLFLYEPNPGDWTVLYNPVDTVFLGYVHQDEIKQVNDDSGKNLYYISYLNDNGEEIGFVGRPPGGGVYYFVPDTCNNNWLATYKETTIANNRSIRLNRKKTKIIDVVNNSEEILECIKEHVVPFDNITVMKIPYRLYKSQIDYSRAGIHALSYSLSRFPIYTDSSFVVRNRTNQYLPPLYNPVTYKPLFGAFFEENIQEILNSNFGKYAYVEEYFDINRISFQVTVQEETCYLIYYWATGTYLLSRKNFRNIKFPQVHLGEEFEKGIGEVLSLDVATILKEYGKPIYMNEDIILYLTGPQRRFAFRSGSPQQRNLEGSMREGASGIMFFEIEDDRVVVAGSD